MWEVCKQRMDKKHIKNHSINPKTVSENRHHQTVIISQSDGIFCSAKNLRGTSYPVHIIKRTCGENAESFCDNLNCIELKCDIT